MKKLLLFLLTSTLSFATATVSGNVFNLSNGAPDSVSVIFTLQNCRSTPRVVGTGLIVSTQQRVAVDSLGNISGTIWRNDEITCVSVNDSFYTVSIILLQGGPQQPVKTMNIKVVTSTLDLNNAPTINNLTPAPFNPINVITNPPASQNIAQPVGTSTTVSGDGYVLAQQASSDTEHGIQIADSTGLKLWHFAQMPTNVGQPSYSFMLRSVFSGVTENYLRCVHDGAAVNSGSCRWMGGLVDTEPGTIVDFSGTVFRPPSGAVKPSSCTAKIEIFLDTTGTGGQKLFICNSAGNGWDLMGDGGGSSAVSSWNTRTGAVVPAAGDYSTITETLQNKTIDSVNNTMITRSKLWYDAAGCVVSTAGVSLNTPATGGATATCAQGTINTQVSFGILSYADAATTVATGTMRLPSDYSGASASVDIAIKWYQDTSVGDPVQNVRWNFAITCVGDAENLDKVWNTATAVTSATKAQYLHQTASTTALTSTSCDAGDILLFKVERLGSDGADTFTNSARLVGAELTLVRSQ